MKKCAPGSKPSSKYTPPKLTSKGTDSCSSPVAVSKPQSAPSQPASSSSWITRMLEFFFPPTSTKPQKKCSPPSKQTFNTPSSRKSSAIGRSAPRGGRKKPSRLASEVSRIESQASTRVV